MKGDIILILNIIQPILSLFTLIVLLLTLLGIIYYALETNKLRKATIDHNELMIRPCLTIVKGLNKSKLRNIGNGTAINISIEDYKIRVVAFLGLKDEEFTFKWDHINKHLMSNDDMKLGEYYDEKNSKLNKLLKEKGYDPFDFPFLHSSFENYSLKIFYNDISNNHYVSKVHIDCKKRRIEFLESHKVNTK